MQRLSNEAARIVLLSSNSRKKYYLTIFCNPKIPGLGCRQFAGFGIGENGWDPAMLGFGIPGLQLLLMTLTYWVLFVSRCTSSFYLSPQCLQCYNRIEHCRPWWSVCIDLCTQEFLWNHLYLARLLRYCVSKICLSTFRWSMHWSLFCVL